jgi:phage gp29-like protein
VIAPIIKLIGDGGSLDQVKTELAAQYPKMDSARLEQRSSARISCPTSGGG